MMASSWGWTSGCSLVQNLRWLLVFLTFFCLAASTLAMDTTSDKRCKCICPRINGTGRAVFIQSVAPEQCTCDRVVLLPLREQGYHVTDAFEFCAKCQCKHENRNSVTIKVVVIMFVIVTCLLLVYMVYLLIEARLCKGSKAVLSDDEANSVAYEQHLDEEEYTVRDTVSSHQSHAGMSLRARFTAHMSRWKRAVTQQRGNVYVRRTVLNN